ncbi:MAG: sulfotransferase [Roseovarius sp.]
MTEKVFLLGVGAQKAGTTWLHDYLNSHPETDMGFIKEYHVMDGLFIPECAMYRDKYAPDLALMREGKAPVNKSRKIAFLHDLDTYFDYFAELLSQPEIRLAGDITPSYSGRSAEHLTMIREKFEQRGIRTKCIFLMRDPVDRIWSAVRMWRRERRLEDPNKNFKRSEALQVRKNYMRDETRIRSDYAETLKNVTATFGPDDLHVGLFETMFNDETVETITGFLGLSYKDADLGKRVNASAKVDDIPEDLQREVARHYSTAYQAAAERFGEPLIREIWPSYRFLDG